MIRSCILVAVAGILALPLDAQVSDSAAARSDTVNGLACRTSSTSTTARDTTKSAARPERVARVIDTTITLAIADRTWQRDQYDGGIALGTGQRDATRPTWSACAGAAVHLGQVTTSLHNVRGVIHLHADLSALQRAGATRPPADSTSKGSGSTPPAVSPRR